MPEGVRSRWLRLGDGACSAMVLFAQVTCSCILLATVVYIAWYAIMTRGELVPMSSWRDAVWLTPYAATIAFGQRLRQHVTRRPERSWAHAWFLGLALLALFRSFSWFQDPMHDIGMALGSHGRWGCGVVDDDGSPYYTLRDDTVPFILFVPVVLVVALHGLVTQRQGIREAATRLGVRADAWCSVGVAFVSAAISALVMWLLTLLLRAWLVAAG